MNSSQSRSQKIWLLIAALVGATGVGIGAFGAHGLPDYLRKQGASEAAVEKRLATFETGAKYQMVHAAALVGLAALMALRRHWALSLAGTCWLVGVVVFSGLLYALALTDVKILGAIVPIGGVAFIAGWLALAVAAWGWRE